MYRKAGMKKMALSFILAIALASGVASIGYCGGGAGEPDLLKMTGPSLNGILIIDGVSSVIPDPDPPKVYQTETITFIGKCNGMEINAIFDITTTNYIRVPLNGGELANKVLEDGQTALGILTGDQCNPTGGDVDGSDWLIIEKVHSFDRVENGPSDPDSVDKVTAVAEVTLKWLIPDP